MYANTTANVDPTTAGAYALPSPVSTWPVRSRSSSASGGIAPDAIAAISILRGGPGMISGNMMTIAGTHVSWGMSPVS